MRRILVLAAVFALVAVGAQAANGTLDVIVSLHDGVGYHQGNQAVAAQVASEHGLAARHTYGTALVGFSASVPEARLEALRNDPRVASVTFDRPVYAVAPPCWVSGSCDDDGGGGDGGQTLPWGVDRIDADLNSNTGSGIHAYVIDSGIDADHRDLQGNLGNGYAVEQCKGGGCVTAWDDDNGHGTHVAGTIGAIDNDVDVVGVAPAVTLHAVKVLNKRGSGSWSGVISGIDWVASETAARNAASVANMSLGGSGSKTGTCSNGSFSGDDAMHQAICNAANVGVVFVVAAGNDGADAEGFVPAAYDDAVITVSATNKSDDWASWSNWGDNSASWTSNNSAPVGIAAPGVSILSTWNDGGTHTISGTSMASPHAAGAAALYLASSGQNAAFSAFSNTRSSLLSSAESTDGFSNSSGHPHDEDFVDAASL